jgi:hypothetical protein
VQRPWTGGSLAVQASAWSRPPQAAICDDENPTLRPNPEFPAMLCMSATTICQSAGDILMSKRLTASGGKTRP